jgi:hypothetical protein
MGVVSRHDSQPGRDGTIQQASKTPSIRMLAMDRHQRNPRRIRKVPAKPRPAKAHGTPMVIRDIHRADPRRNADRPPMPHRRHVMPRRQGLRTQKMRQSRASRGSHRQREHDEAAALRTGTNRMPEGPPLQRRQPDQWIGWPSPLQGMRPCKETHEQG